MKSLSFKTKFGWITAFEEKGKIVRIKFAKHQNITSNMRTFHVRSKHVQTY